MRRFRVLQVFNKFLEPGGQEAFVGQIARHLGAAHEVLDVRFDSATLAGPGRRPDLRKAAAFFYNRESFRRLVAAHERFQPDVWLVHTVFPAGSPSVYHAAIKTGARVIQYCHDYRPFSVNSYLWAKGRPEPAGLRKNFWPEILAGAWRGSRWHSFIYALMLWFLHATGWLRHVRFWVAVSDFQRARFVEAGVPAEKIVTVRHFWLPRAAQRREGAGEGYLFLGRLAGQKGVGVLISCWRLLKEKLGGRTPDCVIAGTGPEQELFLRQAAGLPQVRFVGRVEGEEKERLLAGCRAVVAPSLSWETSGLTVLEACDYGKPALVARSGGLPENVIHGQTGFIHEPGDAGALCEQIALLEAEPERAVAMGRAGRNWLEREASFSRWLGEIEELIRRASGSPQGCG